VDVAVKAEKGAGTREKTGGRGTAGRGRSIVGTREQNRGRSSKGGKGTGTREKAGERVGRKRGQVRIGRARQVRSVGRGTRG